MSKKKGVCAFSFFFKVFVLEDLFMLEKELISIVKKEVNKILTYYLCKSQ